jgi:hypothetical protein
MDMYIVAYTSFIRCLVKATHLGMFQQADLLYRMSYSTVMYSLFEETRISERIGRVDRHATRSLREHNVWKGLVSVVGGRQDKCIYRNSANAAIDQEGSTKHIPRIST